MNGFGETIFWQLWGLGFLGVMLWYFKAYLSPTDLRRSGPIKEVVRQSAIPAAWAMLCHLILCVIFWEAPRQAAAMGFNITVPATGYLNALSTIASGFGANSVTVAILDGILHSRLKAVGIDDNKPSEQTTAAKDENRGIIEVDKGDG